MDVSVDTNVFIHLYKSGYEEILFSLFDNIYVYEYIIESELKNVNHVIYQKVIGDINNGKIELITKAKLVEKGINDFFLKKYREYEILFAGDAGEAYAIAMAEVLGCEAFVSNDVKEGGPHETLLKELIEDILPFAYYELLHLKFLIGEISCAEFNDIFDKIAKTMSNPMKFENKIKSVLRRFNPRYATTRDDDWIKDFCYKHNINLKSKVLEIKKFIDEK